MLKFSLEFLEDDFIMYTPKKTSLFHESSFRELMQNYVYT